jgi:hypothetical protein
MPVHWRLQGAVDEREFLAACGAPRQPVGPAWPIAEAMADFVNPDLRPAHRGKMKRLIVASKKQMKL